MQRLLISVQSPDEYSPGVRVALVDGDRLSDYHVEESDSKVERCAHGNIYLGRVVNVEPAIQAAFIDIGEDRSAFIHVSDLHHSYKGAQGIPLDRFGEAVPEEKLMIQNVLRRGQSILVQVTKEAIGHKGPSVTTQVSVAGRILVLVAGLARAGISKKIEDPEQRDRLRKMAKALTFVPNTGVIVRTAGRDTTEEDLQKDYAELCKAWDGVYRKAMSQAPPALLYGESDLISRTVRDLFRPEIEEVIVDSEEVAERIKKLLGEISPEYADRVRFYQGERSLFYSSGVEEEIDAIYDRKVPLPGGGSIVIDETEALVAIDINSGRSRKQEDLEQTALLTNVEAAEEIARQLRLRDIGGVIVCDFIDMAEAKNRQRVENALKEGLRLDRSKTWIARMSRFGLIEMTRQRLRPSKDRVSRKTCPTCEGRGSIRSNRNLVETVFRQLRKGLGDNRYDRADLTVSLSALDYFVNVRREDLLDLEDEFDKVVSVHCDPKLVGDQFTLKCS